MMLITGGSGFLGRHLANGHASDSWEFIAPSSRSLDVRNRSSTIDTIRDWKPSAVVHLAYRKGDRPGIVEGSRNVAEAASAAGSTDPSGWNGTGLQCCAPARRQYADL